LLIVALFVLFPALVADLFLQGSLREKVAESREDLFQTMEEVIHRTRRNGRPEMFGKLLLDQVVYSCGRGENLQNSLKTAFEKMPRPEAATASWEFFLFQEDGKPVALGNRPLTRVSVWQKLMTAIFECRKTGRPPTTSEEKISQQLLSDRSAVVILAKSQGHFRKMVNPKQYEFGGWWRLRDRTRPGPTFHLLAFIKTGQNRAGGFLHQATRAAEERCRPFFRIALVGKPGGRSFQRLPAVLRHAIEQSQESRGRIFANGPAGVFQACDHRRMLVAWVARARPPNVWETHARFGVVLATMVGCVLLLRFFLFGDLRALSLRLIIPVLILAGTAPALGFLAISMQEQREKMLKKHVYEAHRRIEEQLHAMDVGFFRFLQQRAAEFRRLLHKDPGEAISVAKIRERFARIPDVSGVFSAYLFDRAGRIVNTLKAPQNAKVDQKLAEGMATKMMRSSFGPNVNEEFEDPVFLYYLANLGNTVEVKMFDDIRLQVFDFTAMKSDYSEVLGLNITLERSVLFRHYLRGLLRNPARRSGLDVGLVFCEEDGIVETIPRGLKRAPEAIRLVERTLESHAATDGSIRGRGGVPAIATAVKGNYLGNLVLVGAVPLADVQSWNRRLLLWTILVSAVVIVLTCVSGWSLVSWMTASLRNIRKGADAILTHQYDVQINESGSDEFAELARGIAAAGETMEDVYSANLVQSALSVCESLQHETFEFHSFCESGKVVGGDFLDAFPLDAGRFLFIGGDTMSQGWQSTLVVAAIRAAVRLHAAAGIAGSADLVGRISRHFLTIRGSLRYMAFWAAVLNLENGTVQFCSAGSCPPLVVGTARVERLAVSGPVLGGARAGQYGVVEHRLEPGTALVLHSNGWWKLENAERVPLGLSGWEQVLREAARESAVAAVEKIRQRLEEKGYSPRGREDDCSLIWLRLKAPLAGKKEVAV
jgi:serine phosphatase RsbU (regulator of sigma subunit)